MAAPTLRRPWRVLGALLGGLLGGLAPGFPRISRNFLIFTKLFDRILQGNWGPGRSWEVLGGLRKPGRRSSRAPARISQGFLDFLKLY